MPDPEHRIELQEALFHRDRFLESDYALGEAIEHMLCGAGTREACLEALLAQQAAYAAYVRAILGSLQRNWIAGDSDGDDDELTSLVG